MTEPHRFRTVAVCGTCKTLKAGVTTVPTTVGGRIYHGGRGFHVCDRCIVVEERPLDDIVADIAGEGA